MKLAFLVPFLLAAPMAAGPAERAQAWLRLEESGPRILEPFRLAEDPTPAAWLTVTARGGTSEREPLGALETCANPLELLIPYRD